MIDTNRIDRIRCVFGDVCLISHSVDVIEHSYNDPNDEVDDSWMEKVLKITFMLKSAEDIKTAYAFSAHQISALEELLPNRTCFWNW